MADVTPGWHAPTGKVIALGALVRYSPKGEQLEDTRRAHQTAYAVYDHGSVRRIPPKAGTWTRVFSELQRVGRAARDSPWVMGSR